MNKIKSSEQIDLRRRRLFGTTALALVAAELGLTGSASAQTKSPSLPAVKGKADIGRTSRNVCF